MTGDIEAVEVWILILRRDIGMEKEGALGAANSRLFLIVLLTISARYYPCFAKTTPSTFLSLWRSLSAVSVCKMIPVFTPLYMDRDESERGILYCIYRATAPAPVWRLQQDIDAPSSSWRTNEYKL